MNSACFIGKFFIACPLLLMFSGCASLSATKANLQEMDQSIEKPQVQKREPPAEIQKDALPGGPVPLEVFAGGSIIVAPHYANRWYPRLIEWANVYRDLANEERDMRNFKFSEKYSKEALAWTKRAKLIQKMTSEKAFEVVEPWIAELKTPIAESASKHFLSKEVYTKVLTSKERLDSLQDRVCLINQGYPLVSVFANLEGSVDLMNQKYFNRSNLRIERVLSALDALEGPVKTCREESEE